MPEIQEQQKPQVPSDAGKRHLIEIDGENIYLFVGENGYHEATIPDENREKNKRERVHMDAVMRRISELHGYFEQD